MPSQTSDLEAALARSEAVLREAAEAHARAVEHSARYNGGNPRLSQRVSVAQKAVEEASETCAQIRREIESFHICLLCCHATQVHSRLMLDCMHGVCMDCVLEDGDLLLASLRENGCLSCKAPVPIFLTNHSTLQFASLGDGLSGDACGWKLEHGALRRGRKHGCGALRRS